MHRNLERLIAGRRKREPNNPKLAPKPEPTLEEVRADWKETSVNVVEEVTDLVGEYLWDIFSDNHEVMAADQRVVDIGSFRGASAFLDAYLTKSLPDRKRGDESRFYMGTIWISPRADLMPVYRMIFRQLKNFGVDWGYHFPQLHLIDLSPLRKEMEQAKPEEYSPSEAFAKDQEEQERQIELEKSRAELDELTSAPGARQWLSAARGCPSLSGSLRSRYEGWPPI